MDSSEITANNFFTKFRRSHRNSSIRKTVLTNFTKFTGKELCQNLFLNKVKKKNSGTCVFLWILQIFDKTLFLEHLRATASKSLHAKSYANAVSRKSRLAVKKNRTTKCYLVIDMIDQLHGHVILTMWKLRKHVNTAHLEVPV